ncbi:OsmC family protein [Ornithinimicrobium murale]|uniref:OsmC family protein n=1 Tax=Ornithinimicrobium murale TaxID=1050153 RepID=UPI000E0DAF39|nr:OsmC family protein [Ornithinimicrobium murale]
MSSDDLRSISLTRHDKGSYEAENARGGRLAFGDGSSTDFTPVELLLTAMAGCSAIDVDLLTSRLAEPTAFDVSAEAEKLRDAEGNHLGEVTITFTVRFPEGTEGDGARERLPDAIAKSRDRLCTVSRTVQLPTPVSYLST